MFRANCKAEYRPGFTRCSDCEIDLVDLLLERDLSAYEALTLLSECDDQCECVGVCEHLHDAGIPYHVENAKKAYGVALRLNARWTPIAFIAAAIPMMTA